MTDPVPAPSLAPRTTSGARASKPAFLPSDIDPTVYDEGFLRQLERLLRLMKRPVRATQPPSRFDSTSSSNGA